MTRDMTPWETPAQHLETHCLTRELQRLGVTNEQRQAMRFKGADKGLPFDRWSVTAPGNTPNRAIPFLRTYCTLKWLILEDPPSSRDKEDAWRLLAETMAAPTFAIGQATRNAQSERARKPRGKITEDGETINQVILELALNPQYRRDTARELWPRLWQLLNEKELDPKENENSENPKKWTYEYDFKNGRKKITFGRFQRVVSKAHAEKKKSR